MSSSYGKGCAIVFLVTTILCVIVSGIYFGSQFQYEETECEVTNYTYPKSLLDTSHLIKCDCGRRCISDSGTCVKIYGKVKGTNEVKLFFDSTQNKHLEPVCTFAETNCKNAEKVSDRFIALEKAQTRAESFRIHLDTSKPIRCFQEKQNDNIYLENFDYSIYFYVCVGFLVLALFIVAACFCRCSGKDERNSPAFSI